LLENQLGRHRTDLLENHQMAAIQAGHRLTQSLTHGLGRAGDNITFVEEVLPS
jgi:hypothetical protein